MPGMKWIEPIVFSKSSGNPIVGQIFGHQRDENEARNTKMYRGHDTNPMRVNDRYEMNWANSFSKTFRKPLFVQMFGHQRAENEARNTKMYTGQETHAIWVNAGHEMTWVNSFSKGSGNPIFGQIFGHQEAKNEASNTKMYRGQETHPIRVNARYEMNWANSFFKKFRKPCLQTDGPTDRRTERHRGDSSIPPFHLRWSGGIMRVVKYYVQNKALFETWKSGTGKWSITILLGIKVWNNKEPFFEFEGEQEIIFISPLCEYRQSSTILLPTRCDLY